MSYAGELAAIATAVMWATSSMAFGVAARRTSGFATNQFRVFVAWPALALLVMLSYGTLWPAGLDGGRAGWLLLSGFIGITLGDLGYFHALATIGPRLSSVLMATWPIVAVFGGPLGGDPFHLASLPGVFVTVSGVAIVLWCARGGSAWNPGMTRAQWWSGIAGAGIASVGQAIGILLSRRGMAASEALPAGLDALPATLVRMTAGLVGIQLYALLQRRPAVALAVVRDRRALLAAALGAAMGPVIGVWLSMIAAKRCADVGVGAALMALAPLFLLPLAFWVYRSRITVGSLVGTLLTVAGAAWLLVGQG